MPFRQASASAESASSASEESLWSAFDAYLPSSIDAITDLSFEQAVTSQFTDGVAPAWWSSIPHSLQMWFTSYGLYEVSLSWNNRHGHNLDCGTAGHCSCIESESCDEY